MRLRWRSDGGFKFQHVQFGEYSSVMGETLRSADENESFIGYMFQGILPTSPTSNDS